jgi:hypothetical protein
MELLDTKIVLVTISLTIGFFYITSNNNIIVRKDKIK